MLKNATIFLLGLGVASYGIYRTLKLPSRYERSHNKGANHALSTWSALDLGIDPTESEKS